VTDLKKAHIPDVSTQEGLLDIIMLGNILELSKVFSGKSKATLENEEQDMARLRYRRFMMWFADHHLIVLDGELVNPWYVCYRSLLEFATSLCEYKSVWSDDNGAAILFRRQVTEHISHQWPLLLPRFLQLLDSPTRLFTWSGPALTIWQRDHLPPNFAAPESMDVADSPVFSVKRDPSPADAEDAASPTEPVEMEMDSDNAPDDAKDVEAMDVAEEGIIEEGVVEEGVAEEGVTEAGVVQDGEDMDVSGDHVGGDDNGPDDAGDANNVVDGATDQPQSQPSGQSYISC
jgi:hypothetical protein